MNAPTTLLNDLLNRLATIDQSVAGVQQALPVFYENPEGPPYPKTLHRIMGLSIERAGLPMYLVSVRVEKLLLGGPVNTGYAREHETNTNVALFAIQAEYLRLPLLNHPDTDAPLDYKVAQQGPAAWECPNGVARLSFDPSRPDVQYFGAVMSNTFVFQIQQGRRT